MMQCHSKLFLVEYFRLTFIIKKVKNEQTLANVTRAALSQGNRATQRDFAYIQYDTSIVIYSHCYSHSTLNSRSRIVLFVFV